MTCIDFVESNSHCFKCNKLIKSNIAILHNGRIYGRTCAKKQNIYLHNIPNFTKGIFNNNENEEKSSEKKSMNVEQIIDEKRCKEYLILRCSKLSEIQSMNTEKLDDIYTRLEINEITDEDFIYLRNLIRKMNREKTVFSEKNIHFCYILTFELNRLIQENPDNQFYKDLLIYLNQKAHLTERQFESIEKYLKLKPTYVTVCNLK